MRLWSIGRALVLGCLLVGNTWSATPDEVIIIVKRQVADEKAAAPGAAPAMPREPRTIEEVYERWQNMPGMVWLDTPSGKKPLFGFDNVYDANGFPRPRLPDPYTYKAVTNPTDPDAMAELLDWRNAVIKRANFVANQMPEHAFNLGMIGAKNVEIEPNRPTDAKAVGNYRAIDKASISTPLMDAGQARELGAKAEEIPMLPGNPGAGGIEVYWFWHHRCRYCTSMAREWFSFQHQVKKAGYKIMSINLSPLRNNAEIETAAYEVASTLDIWQIAWGDEAEYSSNTLDWNGAGASLGVRATPTVIFINRTGSIPKIERLDGPQTLATMRAMLADVAGWNPATWPPPPVQAAPPEQAPPREPAPGNTTPIESLQR